LVVVPGPATAHDRRVGRFEQVHRDAACNGYVDTRRSREVYGLHDRSLTRHLAGIGWEPWLPGLWVPGAVEPAFEVACRMALAYAGAPALLTGASALHALGVLRRAPDHVELLLPAGRWLSPRAGLCVHYATDFEAVRTIGWRGLRLARAARALADHSRHAGVSALCRAIADAVRLRHVTLAQIRRELAARRRFPGRGRLRRAHGELSGELSHSAYERLGRRLLRTAGITVPARPGAVVHRDRVLAEVDIPFFDLCYGIEVDGPPHLLPAQAARDRARDRLLARTCGWSIDRYLWFELEEEPERFVREVGARLGRLRGGG
jgi:hypothetical protein